MGVMESNNQMSPDGMKVPTIFDFYPGKDAENKDERECQGAGQRHRKERIRELFETEG
jgi:hypothetical protein